MTKFATARLPICYIAILLISIFCRAALAEPSPEDDYSLGAGDIIKVQFFESPALNSEVRISESGTVNLPMIGKLNVGGLNTDETSHLIEAAYQNAGLIKNAHVSVMITQFNSRQVSVLGQVNKPGKFVLDKYSTVIDLLATAGGINPNGGNKAYLIRKIDGQEQKITIDLNAVLDKQSEKNVQVLTGDIIYVPDAEKYYIYGEVLKTGIIKLEPNMTVLHAISAAGGITSRGSLRGVELKRLDKQGNIQTLDVELDELVQPNDVIYIPEGWL
ncbi:SLBB domain-containing protein [Methylomonas paludis]|uniref:SLBB domain-containing protein n=1 Tax=Methylomonas paludis TaxID=1173101 RepID=A0A975MPK9_9GAMM|nr:SLBB domain-containing protein [Methylomonas paludis]QWF71686.1 SLBB domain-containing protein [Methylomonas paludis]